MTPEIRKDCYDRIRQCMKDGITQYYKAHPERVGDKRSEDAIRESLEGLQCIFKVLDDFDLKPHNKVKA